MISNNQSQVIHVHYMCNVHIYNHIASLSLSLSLFLSLSLSIYIYIYMCMYIYIYTHTVSYRTRLLFTGCFDDDHMYPPMSQRLYLQNVAVDRPIWCISCTKIAPAGCTCILRLLHVLNTYTGALACRTHWLVGLMTAAVHADAEAPVSWGVMFCKCGVAYCTQGRLSQHM